MRTYGLLIDVKRSQKGTLEAIDDTYYFEVPAKNEANATSTGLQAALDQYPMSSVSVEGVSRLKNDTPVKTDMLNRFMYVCGDTGVHIVTPEAAVKYNKRNKKASKKAKFELPWPKTKVKQLPTTTGSGTKYNKTNPFTEEVLLAIAKKGTLS
jgi:hypothetical protein